MSTVLDEIAKETNGKSFKTYKYGFDGIAVPRFDYEITATELLGSSTAKLNITIGHVL